MSGDEVFAALVCLAATVVTWGRWLWEVTAVARCCSPLAARTPLLVAPVASAVLLLAVLRTLASFDVRDDVVYQGFYLLMGAAWVGLAVRLLGFLGLSARDDVIERANPAAARALAGALTALTLCFAGGNVGDGPGWWVVVASALLATGGFFLLWVLLDRAARVADTLTIDRDLAAGTRLAGFFVAAGSILGRAVAGDWVSLPDTVADFARLGWPALALALAAAWIERRLRPTPERPVGALVRDGMAPALAYLVAAALALAWAGPWS